MDKNEFEKNCNVLSLGILHLIDGEPWATDQVAVAVLSELVVFIVKRQKQRDKAFDQLIKDMKESYEKN